MNIKTLLAFSIAIVVFVFADAYCCPGVCYSWQEKVEEENLFMHSDSSKINKVVYTDEKGFIAFDKEGNELFQIFSYDNGPDYTSDGLFRIVKKGKIGYTDELGNIVINPQFNAALPFQNGMAAFCDGCNESSNGEHKIWEEGNWGFINKKGEIAIPAKYDRIVSEFEKGVASVEYSDRVFTINKAGSEIRMDNIKFNEWIDLLGVTAKLICKLFFGDSLNVNATWLSNDKFVFSAIDNLEYLRIDIITAENRKLLEYDIIPWQNFAVKPGSNFLISLEEVCTVTDYAVIYSIFNPGEKVKGDVQIIEKFNALFSTVVEKDINNLLQNEEFFYPENVEFISKKVYPYYADLQIALPGTIIPDDSEWVNSCKGKIIHLQLIPDIGSIKQRWIKTMDKPTDTYYTSVEDDLLNYFNDALNAVYNSPSEKNVIFDRTMEKVRQLFSAANSYVNFLYDKYEERLRRWLFIDEPPPVDSSSETIFNDYQPKHTPDTVLDFMPSIVEEIDKLPAAELENYSRLLQLLKYFQKRAEENPGHWEDGNMVLGAQPREYQPTIDELLASVVGDRLAQIIKNNTEQDIITLLKKDNFTTHEVKYTKFTFIHVDVMGSGRFFYVLSIESKNLNLIKTD